MSKFLFTKGNKYRFKVGNKINLGRTMTEETKEKISKSKLGKIPWNKGQKGLQKHTDEWKINMSKKIKELGVKPPILSGEKHPNWKGGVSNYPAEWTGNLHLKIWQRDKNECQVCHKLGKKRTDLVVHHKNFNKKDCYEDNLILLCRNCHMKIHWQETKRCIGIATHADRMYFNPQLVQIEHT